MLAVSVEYVARREPETQRNEGLPRSKWSDGRKAVRRIANNNNINNEAQRTQKREIRETGKVFQPRKVCGKKENHAFLDMIVSTRIFLISSSNQQYFNYLP